MEKWLAKHPTYKVPGWPGAIGEPGAGRSLAHVFDSREASLKKRKETLKKFLLGAEDGAAEVGRRWRGRFYICCAIAVCLGAILLNRWAWWAGLVGYADAEGLYSQGNSDITSSVVPREEMSNLCVKRAPLKREPQCWGGYFLCQSPSLRLSDAPALLADKDHWLWQERLTTTERSLLSAVKLLNHASRVERRKLVNGAGGVNGTDEGTTAAGASGATIEDALSSGEHPLLSDWGREDAVYYGPKRGREVRRLVETSLRKVLDAPDPVFDRWVLGLNQRARGSRSVGESVVGSERTLGQRSGVEGGGSPRTSSSSTGGRPPSTGTSLDKAAVLDNADTTRENTSTADSNNHADTAKEASNTTANNADTAQNPTTLIRTTNSSPFCTHIPFDEYEPFSLKTLLESAVFGSFVVEDLLHSPREPGPDERSLLKMLLRFLERLYPPSSLEGFLGTLEGLELVDGGSRAATNNEGNRLYSAFVLLALRDNGSCARIRPAASALLGYAEHWREVFLKESPQSAEAEEIPSQAEAVYFAHKEFCDVAERVLPLVEDKKSFSQRFFGFFADLTPSWLEDILWGPKLLLVGLKNFVVWLWLLLWTGGPPLLTISAGWGMWRWAKLPNAAPGTAVTAEEDLRALLEQMAWSFLRLWGFWHHPVLSGVILFVIIPKVFPQNGGGGLGIGIGGGGAVNAVWAMGG